MSLHKSCVSLCQLLTGTALLLMLIVTSCKKEKTSGPASIIKPIAVKAITIVRTGQTYLSLNAAVNAAITNDSIEIPAGLYTNDFVKIGRAHV